MCSSTKYAASYCSNMVYIAETIAKMFAGKKLAQSTNKSAHGKLKPITSISKFSKKISILNMDSKRRLAASSNEFPDSQNINSFSHYVPLPAISNRSSVGRKPRLLREKTYTVLNPVYVNRPSRISSGLFNKKTEKVERNERTSTNAKSENNYEIQFSKVTNSTLFWFAF